MLLLFILAGTAVVLLGDVLAARTVRRLGIRYGWYVPVSWALYLALGALVTPRLTYVGAAVAGAAIGYVDGALGSWLAYRVGVMHWQQPPTVRFLLAAGVPIAVMCGLLALLGALAAVWVST